jgi:hypothetical protein
MSAIAEAHRLRTTISINSNPFIITSGNAEVPTSITNAYGQEIAGPPVPVSGTFTCGVFKENNTIPQAEGMETPVTIDDSYYLIVEYTDAIPERMRFNYVNDKRFETLKMEKVQAGGEHVYSRVPLKELDNV